MRREQWARLTFALTALCMFTGLAVQLSVTAGNEALDGTQFDSMVARIFNVFCFFTVQSNLIVGVTTLLLAIRLDRTSMVFRAFRLAGVIDIAITGIVYHLTLADLQELDGKAAVADQLLHTAVPILAVAGWLVFGPRGLTSWRVVAWSTVIPVQWVVFTLIRGPIVDWYPYPFMDVRVHGYAVVIVNVLLVAAIFVVLAAGATWLDGVLGRRLSPGPDPVRSSPAAGR